MATPSVTHTFVGGQTALASQVNTNFSDVVADLSDGTADLDVGTLRTTGNISLEATSPVRFYDTDSSNYSEIKSAGTQSSNRTITLPNYALDLPVTAPTQGMFSGYIGTSVAYKWAWPNGETTAVATSYTVEDNFQFILVTTAAVDRTITLPAAASYAHRVISVKKVDSGAGTVTIDGNGAETIDGVATIVLIGQYESVDLVCSGTAWHVVNQHVNTLKASSVLTNTNFPATGVTGDITSIVLPARGEWDISAVVQASANGATVTRVYTGVGTVTGNDQTGMSEGDNTIDLAIPLSATRGAGGSIASYRVNISASTTYYLKILGTFSVATPQYVGRISARRLRVV